VVSNAAVSAITNSVNMAVRSVSFVAKNARESILILLTPVGPWSVFTDFSRGKRQFCGQKKQSKALRDEINERICSKLVLSDVKRSA